MILYHGSQGYRKAGFVIFTASDGLWQGFLSHAVENAGGELGEAICPRAGRCCFICLRVFASCRRRTAA